MASWLPWTGRKTKVEGSDEGPVSGAVSTCIFHDCTMSCTDYWIATETIRPSDLEPAGAQRRRGHRSCPWTRRRCLQHSDFIERPLLAEGLATTGPENPTSGLQSRARRLQNRTRNDVWLQCQCTYESVVPEILHLRRGSAVGVEGQEAWSSGMLIKMTTPHIC
jgi:hypothetical protein